MLNNRSLAVDDTSMRACVIVCFSDSKFVELHKKMWNCVKDMTMLNNTGSVLNVCNEHKRANELFFKGLTVNLSCKGNTDTIAVDTTVVKAFRALHKRKACGPNRISPLILRDFAYELAPNLVPIVSALCRYT